MVIASIFRLQPEMTGSCVDRDWAASPECRDRKEDWTLGFRCQYVCVLCVSERAGSGCGHPSCLICRESVASDHMVESVTVGQRQAKTFPQSEN